MSRTPRALLAALLAVLAVASQVASASAAPGPKNRVKAIFVSRQGCVGVQSAETLYARPENRPAYDELTSGSTDVNLWDPTGHCPEGTVMHDGVCPVAPSAPVGYQSNDCGCSVNSTTFYANAPPAAVTAAGHMGYNAGNAVAPPPPPTLSSVHLANVNGGDMPSPPPPPPPLSYYQTICNANLWDGSKQCAVRHSQSADDTSGFNDTCRSLLSFWSTSQNCWQASVAPVGGTGAFSWWPVQQSLGQGGPDCTACANIIQKRIGGDIVRLTPKDGAPYLGSKTGNGLESGDWAYHDVVMKDGVIYDSYTGPNGLPTNEYLDLFPSPDGINIDGTGGGEPPPPPDPIPPDPIPPVG